MSDPPMLHYQKPPRVSSLAVTSFVLALISIPLCVFFFPAVLALIMALIAGAAIKQNPANLGGLGFTVAAKAISGASLLLLSLVLFAGMFTSNHKNGHGRSYCAANLSGLLKAANVYANDSGGSFPIVPHATYTAALNNPTSAPGLAAADDTLNLLVAAPPPNAAGSPVANMWLLVLKSYVAPKQFVCRTDPFTSYASAPIEVSGKFATNIDTGKNLSYSFAYPWDAAGNQGRWWRDRLDPTLPLASDMAPLEGTGTPARRLGIAAVPADNKTWNSDNHKGEGQNVGYSDAHTTFEKSPTVGQKDDHIFTTSGTGRPQKFGGTPATPLFPAIPVTAPPPGGVEEFDIILVPVRNATTGAM